MWFIKAMLQPEMGVEPKIMGNPPKSSIFIGFSIINHPFLGTTIFGNIQILRSKVEILGCDVHVLFLGVFLSTSLGGGNSNIFSCSPRTLGK